MGTNYMHHMHTIAFHNSTLLYSSIPSAKVLLGLSVGECRCNLKDPHSPVLPH